MPDAKPVNIFIAYAHADEVFLRPLRKHLEVLEDDGVSIWYDGEILPGEEWDASIKKRLKVADIIILLVSIDFLTSDYVKGTELPTALNRHEAGECTVVPVIVRNCLWQKKLGTLQALPKEAFPVENWSSRDSAYHNVVEGLDKVIGEIKKRYIAVRQDKQIDEDNLMIKESSLVKLRNLRDPFQSLMIYVRGGRFEGEKYNRMYTSRNILISDFYICKYPVTQRQWKQIMGYNPSHFKGDEDRPVENVNWDDANLFIQTLNKVSERQYRLLTELEWDYAASGGQKSISLGFAGSDNLKEVAWYNENSNGGTQKVGLKKPNEIGVFDMNGNVWEWCENEPWFKESHRVIKGGSWKSPLVDFVNGSRKLWSPKYRYNYIGFRLAHDSPM